MKKILLIEDHEELRENTAEILELSNYKVLKAENGMTGLKLAIQEMPDLIICDIMMPVLDGYGVMHALQQNPITSTIPFIILTAQTDRADMRKGMKAGADDYLTKPFEGIELLRAVEACLHREENRRLHSTRKSSEHNDSIDSGAPQPGSSFDPSDREAQTYKKKNILYTEGQRPVNVFYILTGKVKTYKIHPDGKEFITCVAGPGDFIGYTAMLEDTNYQDSAQMLEDAELISIARQEFLQLIGSDRQVARQFIGLMARHVAEKEQSLLNLAYNSLRKRVANGLLQIWEKFGNQQEPATLSGISRENLAHVIGSATESLTRTLSDFREDRLIDIRDGKIYILNEMKLRNLAN